MTCPSRLVSHGVNLDFTGYLADVFGLGPITTDLDLNLDLDLGGLGHVTSPSKF